MIRNDPLPQAADAPGLANLSERQAEPNNHLNTRPSTDRDWLKHELLGLLTRILSGDARSNQSLLSNAFHSWPNDPSDRLVVDRPPRELAPIWIEALWDAEWINGLSPLTRLLEAGYKDKRDPPVQVFGNFDTLLRTLEEQCGGSARRPYVYISYTTPDLSQHRKDVVAILGSLGYTPVHAEPVQGEALDRRLRACNILLQIVAWDAGPILDDQDKPRIQYEFEIAERFSMQRFCYLLIEDTPWKQPSRDLARTMSCRRFLESTRQFQYFRDVSDLKKAVCNDLGRANESGKPIPRRAMSSRGRHNSAQTQERNFENVVHLVDRTEQDKALPRLDDERAKSKPRAHIVVIHGTWSELPQRYYPRARRKLIGPGNPAPEPYPIKPPETHDVLGDNYAAEWDEIIREIIEQEGSTCPQPGVPLLAQLFQGEAGPSIRILHAEISADELGPDPKHTLRRLFEYWHHQPTLKSGQSLFVFLQISYDDPPAEKPPSQASRKPWSRLRMPRSWLRFKRDAGTKQRQLAVDALDELRAEFSTSVSILPELESIKWMDCWRWRQQREVVALLRTEMQSRRLEKLIEDYRDQELEGGQTGRIPMKKLAPTMVQWLRDLCRDTL